MKLAPCKLELMSCFYSKPAASCTLFLQYISHHQTLSFPSTTAITTATIYSASSPTMSSASKASSWAVAASVAAVEVLKDQAGFCRWNYALRSLHQHAKKKAASLLEANKRTFASSSSSVVGRKIKGDEAEKAKRSEESLRTVMYLSCWGPN